MSASHASGHAYARASARGVLIGLALSIVLVVPFAISAAEPTDSPAPTTPATPTTQPTNQPNPAPSATPAVSPATSPSSPTTQPTVTATADPTDSPTPEPSASASAEASPPASPAATSSLLVTFATRHDFAGRATVFASLGLTEERSIAPLNMASVTVPTVSANSAAASLRAVAGVANVESEKERAIEATPDDTLFADQWALPKIGWTALYDRSTPSGSSIVAILDTGVDGSQPDLAGLLLPGAAFAGAGAPDSDPNGHGTAMAGIVAARANNGIGVAGVAFAGVSLMPVTVLGADGTGTDADIIAGIVWAVDHGADVILMSFSSPTYSPSLQAAIDYAWARDVVLVAATGNDGSSTVAYPAGDRGVVGVSNTDENDSLNSSSNYGDDTFLAAPGTDITTTATGDHYASVTGTSASAAMVAGAAGLLRAFDPAATNGQVVYRLAATAADIAPAEQVGNGRLNLAAAIALTSAGSVQPAGAGVFGSGGPIVDPIYVAAACAWTGATSSAWEDASNWSGCLGVGGLPGATDSTSIPATANAPTISVSTGTAIVKDLTVAAGVTLTMTGGTLEIWHDWKVNAAGTFNGTGGTVQFRASGGGGPTFAGSNQFYDILVDSGVEPGFDNTVASVINISHNFTNNNTALSATTNATFVFNGTGAQAITSAVTGTAATFGNLTVNKASGTLTLASNANVTGVVTISAGTVDMSTFSMNRVTNGASFNMSAGTLLRVGGSTGPTGFTTSTLNATSTVEYYGTAQTVSALSYGNLTLNNGNTKTAAAALTVSGTFLIDTSTTFAASTFTHNIGGALTVNGTWSPSTGTANFNGGSNQAISGTTTPITFNNLTVASSATVSTSNTLSVAGNMTVTTGTLDLGTFTADRTAAGGTLSVAAGATLKIGGTNGFPANYTTNTLNATSTIEYSGSSQTVANQSYGHLTLSGSGTKTPAAGLSLAGDFTIGSNVTFAAGSLTHTFAGNFTNNGTFSAGTSTAVFTGTSKAVGGSSVTGFAAISITTGTITLNTSATATALTFQNNAVASSLSHASGIDLTVNGNVTINQASGGGVAHSWNVNAGSATVTGTLTFSVTANNAGRTTKLVVTTGTITVQGDVVMTNALLAANSVIDMSGGAGTLNLGGALTVTTLGTLTPGTTSTVVYNGTGSQTVTFTSAVTYSTLKIDKSAGTATLGAAVTTANVKNITIEQGTLAAGGFNIAMAGTWTNNGGTFSGGATTVTFSGASATITGTGTTDFPAVSIAASADVTMSNTNTATSLTFVATGAAQSLTQSAGSFTISGAVTLNQPTGSFTSAWNINAATATTNGLITFAGSNTTAARVAKIVITSGTLNANAGITFVGSVAAGKVIDMSGGAGTLNLKGALTVPALSSTLTAGTSGSTFVYADTSAQTINYFTAGAYHNLSVSNSSAGGATLSAAITTSNVTGNLRVLTGGKLDNGGFAIAGTGTKTFEVQDGATFRLGGTSAFPTGFATFTLGGAADTSTVDYYGGAQNIVATATISANFDNLTMSGTSVTKTLLGNITCNGLLTVSSSATFALSNKNVTCGSLAGNGTIAFGNSAVANTMTIGSDNSSTTFSGDFSSTNDATDVFVKTGSGTLTLSSTSTYTGTLKASAGTLLVTGTLAATSTTTIDGGTVAGSGTLGIVSGSANGGTFGPGNPASSSGTLATQNFAFAASSTYSVQLNGTTAGTNYDQTSVTGTVSLASATLSVSLGYSPTVGDSYTLIANDSSDAVTGTFSGQAEGSTITVSGVSMTVSYTGGTGNDVTLTVSSITDTWTGASGNNWSTAGNWQDNRVPSAGHVLIFPSGATSFTPNNDIAAGTSFAAITISGSGYTITGNSITLGANGLTASNASGSNTISLAIAFSADRTVTVTNSSATLTLGGAVSGAFNMTKAGSGSLVLNASNTYVNTTISAGTLQVGNGSTTGTLGSGSVTDNGALVFNRSNSMTVNNTISGSGTVSQSGAGTTTLGGSNSYSGATTIAAGTLSISADNNLGTAPGSATPGQLVFSGGTLATTASFTLNANRGASFSSTATIDVASSTTLTYNGIAAGANGLTKTSTGVLTLGGANSYGGATTISAGTLRQGAASTVPSGGAVSVAGSATFDLNGNNATIGSLAGSGAVALGAGTLNTGGDNTSTAYSGTLSGTGGLTKSGSGTFDLGSASITVGALTISAGVVTAPQSGNTFSVSGAWTNNSSTSGLNANNGTVTLAGSSSQTIGGSFATTFKNVNLTNAAGASLSVGATVNGTLTLGGGNITTGANTLYIASGGTVSRTSGQVVGNLKKYVATGTPTVTFEVGSAAAYTPVSVTFASVSVAGDLTAITSAGDHPSISGSLINSAKSANRYWTLTNSGITFTTYSITLNFVAGDLDGGAVATSFFVDRYSASTWNSPRTTSAAATSTTATLMSAFGDFITGESTVPVPGSLSASAISTRRVDLSWLDNASTETGYAVEKGTDGVTYAPYATTAANAVGQSVTGLSASTTYYFRVRTVTATSYSPYVYISMATLSVPVAVADSYSTTEGVVLAISATGLLTNDPDGTNGFFTTTKVTDPAHGSVVVGTDGSFTYTPTAGYSGSDSFTYRVNDGALQSSAATVTLTVATSAYTSAANWPTAADSSKYLELAFPAYLNSSSTVYGATFHHIYRSATSAYTVCYYFEVYESTTLIATHGSAGSPVSCSTGTSYQTDNITLNEVNTASRANNLKVRLIVWSSGGGKSEHRYADVTVDYQLN